MLPVSYTHLDVYKRQILNREGISEFLISDLFCLLVFGSISLNPKQNRNVIIKRIMFCIRLPETDHLQTKTTKKKYLKKYEAYLFGLGRQYISTVLRGVSALCTVRGNRLCSGV